MTKAHPCGHVRTYWHEC